ncbi:B12-binding domain-containing radical SAM protein [Geoalkalibacter halelectricus]|nr:B12-binding domain-containing radical SAM protein [Geoalkalibacter halelectricus]MDO3377724.1 radical SAM protein [Geoalkalibacter halelectricus]
MRIVIATLHVRPSAQAVALAAGCLAAALPEDLRRQARLVDLFPEMPLDTMADAILAQEPELVAMPVYVWNRTILLPLAARLRERRPQLRLVAGGPEAGAAPEALLDEGGFDALVQGEGEESFRALVQALDNQDETPLPGVFRRSPRGPSTGAAALLPDVDSLTSPWLSGVLVPPAEGGVLWEVARGCPFACDFCFDSRGSNRIRPLPWPRLEAELELFVRSRVAQIWILDSTFNYPPERGKKLLRLLAAKAPHIHFHLEAKAEYLDRESAKLLGAISCSVQVGLQSAHPRVLKNIHRAADPEDFKSKIHLLAAEGVTYGLDLIYGLPGDSLAGFGASLDYALDLRPNHLDIFPLAVLPGTVLHRERERLGLQCGAEPPYEIIASPSFSGQDLQRARLLAAAADIFYNRGRAVGFFTPLCRGAGMSALGLLEEFLHWLQTEKRFDEAQLLATEQWQPRAIRDLHMEFTPHLLNKVGRSHLLPAARDLIRYHYHYAEALLGPETLPVESEQLRGRDLWTTPWRLNPAVRLVRFRYEIIDLLQVEEMDLEQFTNLFRPVGSAALFIRRGSEVYCESLEEDFAKLLHGSDGSHSPREIFAGSINRREGEEFVEFAVTEGILLPPAE